MKKNLFPLCLLAIAAAGQAQVKQFWTETLSDPQYNYSPSSVAVAPSGMTYSVSIFNLQYGRVSGYDGAGVRSWASQLPNAIKYNASILSDADSAPIVVMSLKSDQVGVYKLNPANGHVVWQQPIDLALLDSVKLDGSGNIVIAYETLPDRNLRIRKYSPSGAPLFDSACPAGSYLNSMAVAANGQIYVNVTDRDKRNGVFAMTPNGTTRYFTTWENYVTQENFTSVPPSYVACDRNGHAFALEGDANAAHTNQIRTLASNGTFTLQSFDMGYDANYVDVAMDAENRLVLARSSADAVSSYVEMYWYATATTGVTPMGFSRGRTPGNFSIMKIRSLICDAFGQSYMFMEANLGGVYRAKVWAFDASRPVPVWSMDEGRPNTNGYAGAVGRWGQVAITSSLTGGSFQSEAIMGVKQLGFRNMLINGSSFTGGRTITGTANFYSSAGDDRLVSLNSNSSYAVIAPSTTVAAGSVQSVISVDIKPTAVRRAIRIEGTHNGSVRSIVFYIEPPVPASVTLFPTSVKGGIKANATVRLNGDAPTGGLVVDVSSSDSHATVPATVNIPGGDISKGFQVNTTPVAGTTVASILAKANNVTKSVALTITP